MNAIARMIRLHTRARVLRTTCVLLPLLLLTLPTVVLAQWNYTTNNGAITITGYTGPGGVVVIPGAIAGLPVTSIGTNAFFSNESLTSVTVPNSVTGIGAEAFKECFLLTSVLIPDSVTNIGSYAFSDCYGLTNVTIPNSVTSIGDEAFNECNKMTSLTIGTNVTSIGTNAFAYCSSLIGVTIPECVTNIGDAPFAGCTSLTGITVNASDPAYVSVAGVLFNSSQTLLLQYPAGKLASSYVIPNGVTTIGVEAFLGCTNLTNVTLPNSVTSIGGETFANCAGLTNVTIPDSVTSIGVFAFWNCGLASVTIPNSVTSIGETAFDECYRLTGINVTASNPAFASVGGVLFNENRSTLIEYPVGQAGAYAIPNGVSAIGDYAFWSSFYLTSVTIPNSVTNIKDSAFFNCYSMTKAYFDGNAPTVSSSAFGLDPNTTVYYLPGTTGWGPTFGGRPTALWNPKVQIGGSSFGVSTNQFGFTITGSSNLVVVVEASTSLANPTWSPLGTNTLVGGSSYFSDPDWTTHPSRFYRLSMP